MAQKPVIFYNNSLRDAQTGDDGTSYAQCATAIASSKYSKKIMGVISKASDISSISNLVGADVVFDATKNKYKITNSIAYPGLPSAANWRAVDWNGSVFCAVANNSNAAATSPDGITWTARTLPVSAYWTAIKWNGSVFCAIAANASNIAATSSDGITWTQRTLSASLNWQAIEWNGSVFCAIATGYTNQCSTSPDGITWTTRTMANTGSWYSIAWNGAVFCAIASNSSNVANTSSDGITWTTRTLPNTLNWGTIAWSGSVFCVVASSSVYAATSPDGTTWTSRTLPSLELWQALEWNGAVFCAVVYNSNKAATSPDGITWTARTLPLSQQWYWVKWNGSVLSLISQGQTNALISTDGINWPTHILSIFDKLQNADSGSSFKIRAGLSCAQSSESYPVQFISDNHIAPRMTGTLNTEHRIRIHAPNFVEDGGFESGVFSPNWTAGANWVVTSGNKLEGGYSAQWDGMGNNNLVQPITDKLMKGKTYRIILKTQALSGNANAGCITISLKQAGSGTDVYGAISGNSIAPTTTATWTEFDIIPDFTTNNWELRIVPLLANKGSALGIMIDEIYVYRKYTIDTFIADRHNWAGKGAITVNAWRLSPLRSTSGSDANNKTQIGSFYVDSSDTISQALTSTVYPVMEVVIPAVSGWTPEAGEIFMGSGQTTPKFPQSFDPYSTNADGLREVDISIKSMEPTHRLGFIEDLHDKLRSFEGVWWKWDTDNPVLMESPRAARKSVFDPFRVSLDVKLVEKL